MSMDTIQHAHDLISQLQSQLTTLKESTYKTVHDDIGSTISAASIKAKLLAEAAQDSYQKKQLQEIHTLIQETIAHVTTLNKKLKTSWIPQSTENLFQNLRKEIAQISTLFKIKIKFEVVNEKTLQKLDFLVITLTQGCIELYIQEALSRIIDELTITAEVFSDKIEWKFVDRSPLAPQTKTFQHIVKKIAEIGGNFEIAKNGDKNVGLLTMLIKGGK